MNCETDDLWPVSLLSEETRRRYFEYRQALGPGKSAQQGAARQRRYRRSRQVMRLCDLANDLGGVEKNSETNVTLQPTE